VYDGIGLGNLAPAAHEQLPRFAPVAGIGGGGIHQAGCAPPHLFKFNILVHFTYCTL
jgi:hypothetical protein